MRKVLGILTEDFRLYHDLVAALKARDLPFTSLSFARRVPDAVGAILTSPAEASRVHLRNVVPVDDIDSSIAKALQLLRGKSEWAELRIGVDPGGEPGVAIIGDGEVIDTRIAASPEAVAFHVRQAVRTFPAKDIRVRVGLGDPTNRDRILKALARDQLRLEVVDEAGTTHRTAQPDVDAAIDIAKSSGRRVEPPVEIRPTPGEVREIQRRSRLDSGGVVTISSELAGAVARGDLTLEEAITRAKLKDRHAQGLTVAGLELLAAFEIHLLRDLAGREFRLQRLEFAGEVGLERRRVLFHDALEEVQQVLPALRDLVHNPRPSVRRENRGAVHETPREQLDELLVHGSPADLQFLREIFRVVEPFLEEPKDLAACFRPRNTDELQRFRHPGLLVVSAYFNVLPLRIGRRLPGGR